ncbi:hypothetical protein N8956_00435 [bacterium]|jgi:hypothetical protein|nr:hypothetical protein [bacterium]
MTTTNAYDRQPTKFDYASPTQFKFSLLKLPKVEYFCTSVNIPGVTLSNVDIATPLKSIPVPGTILNYGDLEMSFLVDENLENYREIHGWLTGLGFPRDHKQAKTLVDAAKDRFPTGGKSDAVTDAGKVTGAPMPLGPVFSDATLNVLSSKNNTNIEVRFSDMFPVSLSALNFNQQAADVDYLSASVTMKYKIYEFATKGGGRTIETTS